MLVFGAWRTAAVSLATLVPLAAFSFYKEGPATLTGTAIPRLVNISTRGLVETGDNILIGGFVIGGTTSKRVVIRGRGPSMASLGVPGTLADPAIRLFSGSTPIDFNDNWQTASSAGEIIASGLAPTDPKEAALLATVNPGLPYTIHLTGVSQTSGVAIVEVFESDKPEIPLLNISTRGRVGTGDNILIGGFIIQGSDSQRVLINARGPSLGQAPFNIPGALADPTIELFQAGNPTPIASNDNWGASTDAAGILTTGNAPGHALESSIIRTLSPGAYTAIVRGQSNGTGVGLVEVFTVSSPSPTPSLIKYDLAADVPAAEFEFIRSGIDAGRTYLAARMGGDIPAEERSRLTVQVVATGRGNPSPNAFGGGCTALDDDGVARPFFDVRHPCWTATPKYGSDAHKLKTAAHEYTHAWQNRIGCSGRLSGGRPYTHLEGWMTEGEAEFVGLQTLIPSRLDSDTARSWSLDVAITDGQVSHSLRTLEYIGLPYGIWPGNIGYLAIEDLTSRAPGGVLSLRNHCQALANGVERSQAFLSAFGVSKDEYYAAFPAYVAQLRARYGI